ncbi:hypothetical protein VO63_14690 [Streptomyces showdoensis]|uniref:Uncharacterized protein n=1 Tax=Streptomyces showdoensis TaxID=68268 RepID=A0A2P2GQ89_STREW|nr:hypothetical protein VO63_14690 [Streptomyces showdoensis]
MDQDVAAAEKEIGILRADVNAHATSIQTLTTQMGNLPQGQNVAARLAGIDTKLLDMSNKFKEFRYLVFGLAATGTLVKFDIQAIKIDLTLLKKIDEKNVWNFLKLRTGIEKAQKIFTKLTSRGSGSLFEKLKDQILREKAKERKKKEAEDAKEAEKAKAAEKKLQEDLKGLPKRVGKNEQDIDKILKALRGARDSATTARNDRTGLRPNHQGVDAQKPTVGPVAKDVKNLRSAVDQLIASLGAL